MIATQFDKERQLLTLRHVARVDFEQVKSCDANVRRVLPELRPGFRLFADFSELQTMDSACAHAIGQLMDVLNAAHISLVVRVIPDPHRDIGFNILSLFHYSRKVRIVTVETLAEANKILSESEKRNENRPLDHREHPKANPNRI